MHRLKRILALAFLLGLPWWAATAEAPAAEAAAGHAAERGAEHHGLPASAVRLGDGGVMSNSMFVTWIVAAGLILFARAAMKNAKEVPDGKQNFWEWMVESLHQFLDDILGHELVHKTFWFFATIFIFILFANWAGLLPGVGTIGFGVHDAQGHFHVTKPLLGGINADLNMTFGMAMIFFACWLVWAIQAHGVGGFLMELFGPKGDTTGVLKILMIFVFIMVGVLEVVTILFRPLTLSFRLYGNI